MTPMISICIPAYKRVRYLKRLLESIATQHYKNFEIILSDDSDDDSVENLSITFSDRLSIQYFKNSPALGTPANWNYAISKANGEWIKVMHDDDWFRSQSSLSIFAHHAESFQGKFIFSAYANCYEAAGQDQPVHMSATWRRRILHSPVTLLANNVVGPPSVTLIHRSILEQYDERMKWRVDLDFYIRLLLNEKSFHYINEVLVNVGINNSQVTNDCINIPSVELPEGYLLLQKYGTGRLKNILVYDAWWRLLRNMSIQKPEQLTEFVEQSWPSVILSIISHERAIPRGLLKIGFISKLAMFFSWCINSLKSNFKG